MTLLVTGGAGYTGSVVAHQLVDTGHEQAVSGRCWFVEGDLLEAMISDAWSWTQGHPDGYE